VTKEMSEKKVYEVLKRLGVPYVRHEHPPVFTVEQAEEHWSDITGVHCKNIFVRNKKGNRHFLIIFEHTKRIDLKALSAKLGQSRLSFASPERLKRYLGLEPGAVSPFGLINDRDHEVQVLIDEELKNSKTVNFHPNINTATISLSFADFMNFIDDCGNVLSYIKVP
jgi:Ala-tRNA(Pro) deacylase